MNISYAFKYMDVQSFIRGLLKKNQDVLLIISKDNTLTFEDEWLSNRFEEYSVPEKEQKENIRKYLDYRNKSLRVLWNRENLRFDPVGFTKEDLAPKKRKLSMNNNENMNNSVFIQPLYGAPATSSVQSFPSEPLPEITTPLDDEKRERVKRMESILTVEEYRLIDREFLINLDLPSVIRYSEIISKLISNGVYHDKETIQNEELNMIDGIGLLDSIFNNEIREGVRPMKKEDSFFVNNESRLKDLTEDKSEYNFPPIGKVYVVVDNENMDNPRYEAFLVNPNGEYTYLPIYPELPDRPIVSTDNVSGIARDDMSRAYPLLIANQVVIRRYNEDSSNVDTTL